MITTAAGEGGVARLCNPVFTNDFGRVLDIRASNVIVERLHFENGVTPPPDKKEHPNGIGPQHWNVPQLAAVLIETNATNVIVRDCEFSACPIGVRVRGTDSTIVSNRFHDAHKITERWGAIAIAITGSRTVLAYNEIRDYGYLGGVFGSDGAAFEIDSEDPSGQGREIADIDIHDNRVQNVQGGFIEVTRGDVRRIRIADNFSDCQDKFGGFADLSSEVTIERNVIWHRRLPLTALFLGAVTNSVFRDNRVVFREGARFDRQALQRKGCSLDFKRSGNVYSSTAESAAEFFRGEGLKADERYIQVSHDR